MLKFKLIDKCWQKATEVSSDDVDFFLEKNEWDDYGYHTMYHLHATNKLTSEGNVYLGYIRIMKHGQEEKEIYLLNKKQGKQIVFSELPEDFVSLTTSIDVFKGLNKYLSQAERLQFIKQMHLILNEESKYYKLVHEDECFTVSMLRDTTMDNYSLKKGASLLMDKATYYNLQQQSIKIKFANVDEFTLLNFSCLPNFQSKNIPNGVITFIGKNGSGKSTSLYNLAKLMYAYPDQRFRLKEKVGKVEPNDIGINKLFLLSYSPFDNFVLPGIGGEDYRVILEGLKNNDGRFVFCGIRDVKKEFEAILENPQKETYEKLFEDTRLDATSLKPINILADEFVHAMNALEHDVNRNKIWDNIGRKSRRNFPEIEELMDAFFILGDEDRKDNFLHLSTGYKYFFHSLAHIIAYIEEDSLILFDEPENHIHPPMLSFMISSLRKFLSEYQSVMLIATHSPVIVQETFSKNVFVVRRYDGKTVISHPQIETYGANISEITSEVFDLTTDVTKYYDAFESIYEKLDGEENWQSLDEMVESIEKHLDGSISSQMLSYLMNLYIQEHPNE